MRRILGPRTIDRYFADALLRPLAEPAKPRPDARRARVAAVTARTR